VRGSIRAGSHRIKKCPSRSEGHFNSHRNIKILY